MPNMCDLNGCEKCTEPLNEDKVIYDVLKFEGESNTGAKNEEENIGIYVLPRCGPCETICEYFRKLIQNLQCIPRNKNPYFLKIGDEEVKIRSDLLSEILSLDTEKQINGNCYQKEEHALEFAVITFLAEHGVEPNLSDKRYAELIYK